MPPLTYSNLKTPISISNYGPYGHNAYDVSKRNRDDSDPPLRQHVRPFTKICTVLKCHGQSLQQVGKRIVHILLPFHCACDTKKYSVPPIFRHSDEMSSPSALEMAHRRIRSRTQIMSNLM